MSRPKKEADPKEAPPPPESPPELRELARLAGVATEYTDINGICRRPSQRALHAILTALGHNTRRKKDVMQCISNLRDRHLTSLMEPVLAVFEHEKAALSLCFPCKRGQEDKVRISLVLTNEEGDELDSRQMHVGSVSEAGETGGLRHVMVEAVLDMPLPIGYYSIRGSVTSGGRKTTSQCLLIIAPHRCHMVKQRTWGLTLSLYSLNSTSNWGIGDLGDLRVLMKKASEMGAGFVGINPLHATPARLRTGISPYQPLSRLYQSHLYADASALSQQEPELVAKAREDDLLNYDSMGEQKLKALRESFEGFYARGGSEEFRQFVLPEGRSLRTFATYMALKAHIEEKGLSSDTRKGFRAWPSGLRDPDSPEVEGFVRDNEKEISFYEYIQWVLQRELTSAAEAGGDMPIGLYTDLAVGSSAGGSDAWAFGDVFTKGMNMGAPPDDFSPFGQNWLFPPLLAGRMRETGYELFRETLRRNMEHSGALRIDHALGLFRSFWIPEGMGAEEGTYVSYPHGELLKIIALESVRNKTVVIAEDLGTVSEEVRQTLMEHGMLSYRLMYFERDWQSRAFLRPGAYPPQTLSAINTHDLPTLRGYLEATDIKARHRMGLYSDDALKEALKERECDINELLSMLGAYMPAEAKGRREDKALLEAALMMLASTPSLMVAVSLDDLMSMQVQQNLPGVERGHPNWRRKYPMPVEEVFSPDIRETLRPFISQVKQ